MRLGETMDCAKILATEWPSAGMPGHPCLAPFLGEGCVEGLCRHLHMQWHEGGMTGERPELRELRCEQWFLTTATEGDIAIITVHRKSTEGCSEEEHSAPQGWKQTCPLLWKKKIFVFHQILPRVVHVLFTGITAMWKAHGKCRIKISLRVSLRMQRRHNVWKRKSENSHTRTNAHAHTHTPNIKKLIILKRKHFYRQKNCLFLILLSVLKWYKLARFTAKVCTKSR